MPTLDERALEWDTPERTGRASAIAAVILGAARPAPDARVLHGFERDGLGRRAEAAGFRDVAFAPAWEVPRIDRAYPSSR